MANVIFRPVLLQLKSNLHFSLVLLTIKSKTLKSKPEAPFAISFWRGIMDNLKHRRLFKY